MVADSFSALRAQLEQTRLADRQRFAQELQRLENQHRRQRDVSAALGALAQRVARSADQVEILRNAPLRLEYDAELPISAHREQILAALDAHPVMIVCGATGSGKTTQLPKLCLQAGRGAAGLIGHTQPRRIAARAIAGRLAQELGTSVGGAVGYQVRFTDHSSSQCRVKLMTDGILLRELEGDRELRRYDTLIIDEAHERSLNIDLLLGVLRRLSAQRADLKIIITSATIDPEKFARFFNGAPIIEVSGRSYPVEVRYRPLSGEDEDAAELSLPQGIVAAVEELQRESRGREGDVLVFLPGEKQIREADKALRDARLRDTEILPLFARLSTREQERVFEAHRGRRVVLSTNVAETSLTVPGVRYVVDSGLARISRYSVRGKVQRLPIEPISQASAEQRKGRCGRVAEGICIRLYSEADFTTREAFTPPEILRTHLASVILKLASMGFGDPGEFPFIDPPDLRAVNDGYRLLQELKACDEQRRITSLGKQIAGLPVDPRLARMLLAADHHRCLAEMLVLTAFLSVQDPRERPAEAQQQADQHHASYADARSDFITLLTLWRRFHEQSEALSGNQLRKWCREQFLSFMRMREWQEVHAQLSEAIKELNLRPNQVPANYAELHQAILTGFLGHVGTLEENREYLGARGARFVIAPGTPLAAKPPKWVVAGSLVETTRTYARMVAAVEPAWIEAAGAHLLKRTYAEPHWHAQRGFVAAFETVALYGLILSSRRRVNYASVAPREAREIFVRCALVEGDADIKAPFLEHNRQLRTEVEQIEAKIRRRDVLADEQMQVDFYLRHLPESVHSLTALNRHLHDAKADSDLRMSKSDLMRREITAAELQGFPDTLSLAGNQLPLSYKFEPSAADDGVTLAVPEPLLQSLEASRLAACVPGLWLEKTTEILRAMPKALRKHFVPVPTHAAQALQGYRPGEDFHAYLAAWISQHSGTAVDAEELSQLSIPAHLQLNLRITDLSGRVLKEGRDLRRLQRELRAAQAPVMASAASSETTRIWSFGELPMERVIERGGVRFKVYPALEDRGSGVTVIEARSAAQAERILLQGLVRLLILNLPQQYKYVRTKFAQHRELALLGQGIAGELSLADAMTERSFRDAFLAEGPLPRTASAFETLMNAGRSKLETAAESLLARILPILQERRAIRQRLSGLTAPAFQGAVKEVEAQLEALLPPDFLRSVPHPWLGHLSRYLKALTRRLERLPGNPARDASLAKQVQPFAQALQKLGAEQNDAPSEALVKFRWMVEEYRVSLFAQDLRTSIPVSDKRLHEQLELARKATAGF